MNRILVSSSNVATVGYDSETQTLEIEFNNGGVYQYFDVSQDIYEALISADSVGKFLNANIKGYYRYARV